MPRRIEHWRPTAIATGKTISKGDFLKDYISKWITKRCPFTVTLTNYFITCQHLRIFCSLNKLNKDIQSVSAKMDLNHILILGHFFIRIPKMHSFFFDRLSLKI